MFWKQLNPITKGALVGLIIGLLSFVPILGFFPLIPTVGLFGLYGGDYFTIIDNLYAIAFWLLLGILSGLIYSKYLSK